MAVSDGLPIRESGSWIQQKHHPLTYYSEIFNQAMKNKPWDHRVYLELFAGPGKCLIRESNCEEDGSPLKAVEKNFTDYIFIDICEAAARALSQRLARHPKAGRVDIWCGDCAEAIRQITIPSKSLTLAFVDPTRISDAPFFLIETLLRRAAPSGLASLTLHRRGLPQEYGVRRLVRLGSQPYNPVRGSFCRARFGLSRAGEQGRFWGATKGSQLWLLH